MDETQTLAKEAPAFMMKKAEESWQAEAVNFFDLYRRNVTPVLYYLYSRVRNIADAEDLTSQTFMIAFEKALA